MDLETIEMELNETRLIAHSKESGLSVNLLFFKNDSPT